MAKGYQPKSTTGSSYPPNQGSGGRKPGETAKRSCARLQKQYDEALAEIESLNKQLEVAGEERKLLRKTNDDLNKEVNRLARICRQLRMQRDNVHSSLQISIANTNKIYGCLHGAAGHALNAFEAERLIDGLPHYHFTEDDDEIPF